MGGEVTQSDLLDVRDTIVAEMREGFAGIHARQDVTNGRVNKGEVNLARHDERLSTIERRTFNRRKPGAESAPLTRRDLAVGVGVLIAAGAVITWLFNVLPHVTP